MAFSAEAQEQIAALGIDLSKSRGNSLLQDYTEDEPQAINTSIEINPVETPEEAPVEIAMDEAPAEPVEVETQAETNEGDSAPEEVQEADKPEERDTPTEDIEWIKVDGKKVKIDHNNRTHNKKAYELAAGFRAKTVEFDNLKKEFEAHKESVVKESQVMNILNENKGDINELVRLFTGGETDLEQWRQAKNAEEEAIATMSEDEFAAYQRQVNDQKKDAEIEALKAQITNIEETGANTSAEHETKRRNDLVSSTFSRYMFRGKMEDQVNAQTMDDMMWHSFNRAMIENHETWTPEAAELEMKMIHGRVSRAFGREVEKKVEQVVQKKQQVAKQTIAQAVVPAKTTRSRESLSTDIKEKGIFGAFSGLYS